MTDLGGRYRLEASLGRGGTGEVFRARDLRLDRVVAIKMLHPWVATDEGAHERFRREATTLAQLRHPNIVQVLDFDDTPPAPFLVQEHCGGGTLVRRTADAPLPWPEVAEIGLAIARGLAHAHASGVTHRDLKLTNVLLSAQGVAKLVDFGLAGQDAGLSSMEEEVDRAVEYATLERSTNAPDNDPRSDLYFLGAIFYELLTGVAPYPPSKSREDRKQPSRYRNIRPIRQVDPSIPPAVMAIINQLLQINPNERYQSPTEVIQDLQTIVGTRTEENVSRGESARGGSTLSEPLAPASDVELPAASVKEALTDIDSLPTNAPVLAV